MIDASSNMDSAAASAAPGDPPPPYPATTSARGWHFDLDLDRLESSDTWALLPAELRPWALMLWVMSWRSRPCGTWPDDDRLIAARIGMPLQLLRRHRDVLMRGWVRHADGRLYHDCITAQVIRMLDYRARDRARVAKRRSDTNQALSGSFRSESDTIISDSDNVRSESDRVQHLQIQIQNKERKKEERKKEELWQCPQDVDPTAWADWLAVRRRKRAAMSARAWHRALAVMDRIRASGERLSDAVARSADRGWVDLYPRGTSAHTGRQGNSAAAVDDLLGALDTTGAI